MDKTNSMIWKLTTSRAFFCGGRRYIGAGPWMMDRQQAGGIISQCPVGCVEADPWQPLDASQDWNGKTILVMRGGGIGDLMMATPMLRELKARWPSCRVVFSCHPQYAPVLEGNPHVDELAPYPLPIPNYPHDALVWLGDVIEENEEANKRHACDVIAGRAGVTLSSLQLTPPKIDKEFAQRVFPQSTWQRRLGIQISASAACRSIAPDVLAKVMLLLHDWQIVLLGSPGESTMEDLPRIVNASKRKLSFLQSCSVADSCHVLLTPDSAMFHVGGALGIPTVGVFGPFDGKLRQTSKRQHILQGRADCAPCFHHTSQTPFPIDKPCAKVGKCLAMQDVTAEQIVEKILEIA